MIFTGILALWLTINAFKPQIEAAASRALGMDARIDGKVGIALFPDFGLSLKDVKIWDQRLGKAKIEKLWIGLKLFPLASFEIEISQIDIFKPVFSIVRSNKGFFNVEKLEGTLQDKLFAVKKMTISQGILVYRDEASNETIEVSDFDVSIKSRYASGVNSAEPFKKTSFTGDIKCKTLKIQDLTLMNLMMRTAGEKGICDINPVSMSIFGGRGSGSIHVDLTGPLPYYRVICALNQIRIEELVHLYAFKKIPRKTIEGMIDVSADLTARGTSADEIRRSLDGNLEMNGEDLMLHNVDIDALIIKYERSQNFNLLDVGAFLLAGPFGPIITKSYNLVSVYEESQGGKGSIRKLVSAWKVKNGIAEALDVALASKKHRIAMQGQLDFIQERFVDVTIAALDNRGCAVYSEKVHGPFSDPQIEKENAFKSIAGSVLNPIKNVWDFIRGRECTVFYSGSIAQPEG